MKNQSANNLSTSLNGQSRTTRHVANRKKGSRSKALWLPITLGLLLSACSMESGEKKQEKKDEQAKIAVPVEVSRVARGDIDAIYANTTSLEAEQEAVVVAKLSELLQEIYVEEGDVVKKGQPLAQLDVAKLNLELKQAEANLKRLKAELDRNKRIYDKKMVSSDVYERLKFDYEAQQASFELSKLQMTYATVRAPIDGVISQRMVKVGNMITTNEPMFRITDFDPLHAIIHVPEKELNKLSVNQPAKLQLDAMSGKFLDGSVKLISPIVDSTSGTFKVTVKVDNPDGKLKPGMFGRVGIIYDSHKETLLLDKNALIADEDQPAVFTVNDGKATKSIVHTGFSNEKYIEIISGLSEGDEVVIAGQNSLKNESPVEILGRESQTAEVK